VAQNVAGLDLDSYSPADCQSWTIGAEEASTGQLSLANEKP